MCKFKPTAMQVVPIVSMVIAVLLLAPAAMARDEVRVPALTAPYGTGLNEEAIIFERLIAKKHPWLRVIAQESPGFVYNVQEMGTNKKRWKTTVTWSSTGAFWAGNTKQEGFFAKRIPSDDFRWLVTRTSTCIFFGALDDKIKSIKDFAGKKIGMGLRSQTHWGLFATRAIQYGMGVKNASLDYLGPNPATAAMLDRRVNAAVLLSYMPADLSFISVSPPMRKLEASGRKYHFISIPQAATDKINKGMNGVFVTHKLPANSMPNQTKPLECMGDFVFMAAHKSFPDDIAYQITKVYLDINVSAGKYIGGGKLYTRKSICTIPPGIKPHPAAIKACKDEGVGPYYMKK